LVHAQIILDRKLKLVPFVLLADKQMGVLEPVDVLAGGEETFY
jgi:hypothetical protein